VRVLLVQSRRSQLGDGQATGSNPTGIELGTKASFRDRSKVVAWSTVSSHKIRESEEGSAHPGEREGAVDGSEGRCSRSVASTWRSRAART
jgi:hypothetical protein